MTAVQPSNTASVHGPSNKEWADAVRKEAVIRPLAEGAKLGRASVQAAAQALGLSVPRVYALVGAFRRHPVATSMLSRPPGQLAGARRLDPTIEAQVEAAIGAIYLTPERLTVKRLFRQVRQDCLAAGLSPPSMKALRARVTARGLRERAKAREGAEVAAARFTIQQGVCKQPFAKVAGCARDAAAAGLPVRPAHAMAWPVGPGSACVAIQGMFIAIKGRFYRD